MEQGQDNRKVILNLAVSLDGYIEGPNGEVDWLTFSEETGEVLHRFLNEIDTILYGRVSYEKWGTYRPSEDSSEAERHFYEKTGKMSKLVFSTTTTDFEGDPFVVPSDIEGAMERLKQQEGKDIWLYGGSELITSFFNLDLIDELRISISPIILGDGKPLFKGILERKKLELCNSESYRSGMVTLTYKIRKG